MADKGFWVVYYDKDDKPESIVSCRCSVCGNSALLQRETSSIFATEYCRSKYCPHCGTLMEG